MAAMPATAIVTTETVTGVPVAVVLKQTAAPRPKAAVMADTPVLMVSADLFTMAMVPRTDT